jgi:hypothetical protein
MGTACHANGFAYGLAKRCAPDSVEKIADSLTDAQVNFNRPMDICVAAHETD